MGIHHLMNSLLEQEQLGNKKINWLSTILHFISYLISNNVAWLTDWLTQLVSFSSKSRQTGTAHCSKRKGVINLTLCICNTWCECGARIFAISFVVSNNAYFFAWTVSVFLATLIQHRFGYWKMGFKYQYQSWKTKGGKKLLQTAILTWGACHSIWISFKSWDAGTNSLVISNRAISISGTLTGIDTFLIDTCKSAGTIRISETLILLAANVWVWIWLVVWQTCANSTMVFGWALSIYATLFKQTWVYTFSVDTGQSELTFWIAFAAS